MTVLRRFLPLAVLLAVLPVPSTAQRPGCSADNAEITLPAGFCAQIVADQVGGARHAVVLPNGDIIVALQSATGGVLVLRDTNGDGVAEEKKKFGSAGYTGIAHFDGYLYAANTTDVVRWKWNVGDLEPKDGPETIVSELTAQRQHAAKTIAISRDGSLFVNIGVPSNSCQEKDRQIESKGQDPCPLLEIAGGIWRFDARKAGQKQPDGTRWVTGTRNVVALAMDAEGNTPWGVQHGRDNLTQNWSAFFNEKQSAENPAEEMFRFEQGKDFGWPYCFYSNDLKKKVLAPEYGGDGKNAGRCERVGQPVYAFPGHWAPDALVFYTGTQFPEEYRGGAFIAFHGSWNRAPLPQAGFNVSFLPFRNGAPAGPHTVFADGFRGGESEQKHRPAGLAVAPDGTLIVTDDRAGRIYRIRWVGK
jgi:glucose/arabinose dehydrogenase